MNCTIDPSKITVNRIYIFRKGPMKCELYSGYQTDLKAHVWMFRGYCPFPVHTNTWFIGLNDKQMIAYMADYGWKLSEQTGMFNLATQQYVARERSEMNLYIYE